MSHAQSTPDSEETNGWHALPMLIGNAITKNPETLIRCGGYAVDRDDDGDLFIYRSVDTATDPESLTETGDLVNEAEGYATAYELVGSLPAPADGWSDEVSAVSTERFRGYR